MSDEELIDLRKKAKLPLTHELLDYVAESKQREATLTLERDAARNALEIARKELKTIEHCAVGSTVHFIASWALAKISDPTTALAERDRAIVDRLVSFIKNRTGYVVSDYLIREFWSA